MKKKSRFIILSLFVLVIAGAIIFLIIKQAKTKQQEREWIQTNLVIGINSMYQSPQLTNPEIPKSLQSNDEIVKAHNSLKNKIDQLNEDIDELNGNIDDFENSLNRGMSLNAGLNYSNIQYYESIIYFEWDDVQEAEEEYITALQNYWTDKFSDPLPQNGLVYCYAEKSIEEIIPEGSGRVNQNQISQLGKRQCTYYSMGEEPGRVTSAPTNSSEPAAEEAESIPDAIPTPAPAAYSASSVEIPYSDYVYLTADKMYTLDEGDKGQVLVSYNLTSGDKKEIAQLGRNVSSVFFVSSDEKTFVFSNKLINLENPQEITDLPFWTVALSPDGKVIVGLVADENGLSLGAYDTETFDRLGNLTRLTVTAEHRIHFIPQFSASGELFALAYYEDYTEENRNQLESDDSAKSGFGVWQTNGWSKIIEFPRDDHLMIQNIIFTNDEQAVVVSAHERLNLIDTEKPAARLETYSIDPQKISATPVFFADYITDNMPIGLNQDGSIIVQPNDWTAKTDVNDDVYLLDPYTGEMQSRYHLDNLVVRYISSSGILLVNNGTDNDEFQVILPIEN